MNLDTIPKEMLLDIIKVFLFGRIPEYRGPETGGKYCLIRHVKFDWAVEYEDLFSLREPLISYMRRSGHELMVSLADSMEEVHDELKQKAVH